jgi:hypothetical protein
VINQDKSLDAHGDGQLRHSDSDISMKKNHKRETVEKEFTYIRVACLHVPQFASEPSSRNGYDENLKCYSF